MFRNAVMYALPFMLMGYGIRCAKDTEDTWYKKLSVNSPRMCCVLFIAGYLCSIAEYAFHKTSIDIYFGTLLSVWALFTFTINFHSMNSPKLAFIGRQLSLYVYVVHLIVIDVLSSLSMHPIYRWILPILAILVSISVAWIYEHLTQTRSKTN